jgi:uncharacterized protein (DUF697 family)
LKGVVQVGWVPGLGNAINATTAAGLTEAVGWAADAYFSDEGNKKPPAEGTGKAKKA